MRAESLPILTAGTASARAGWIVVQPTYRRRFARVGLIAAADFINLPGEVISGHADRHVVRVVLGRGLSRIVAFLKREHRVPWRERLRNCWAGFGWVSQSEREVRLLHRLRQARVPVPYWLAYGEDGRGRAFALVRGITSAVDLRLFLHAERQPAQRRDLARRLGKALARVHAAGFDCPHLASKHVLVRPRGIVPFLIDWQRATQAQKVRWPTRICELAALHASLAEDLATPRERLVCLRAYLRAILGRRPALRPWVEMVLRKSEQFFRRRAFRDLRRLPLTGGSQRLRWVDGESLVVTRPLWRANRGRLPDWLVHAAHTPVPAPRESAVRWRDRPLVLLQFPPATALQRWWNWLCSRHEIAAGPRLGGRLFRRERCGLPGPRPLAFGQRPDGGSFILLRPTDDGGPTSADRLLP